MRSPAARRRALIGTLALATTLGLAGLPQTATAATEPFISEIHYDNAGTDVGEAVEVTADPGTDLTGWTITLYSGGGWMSPPQPGATALALPYATSAVPTVNDQGVAVISYPTDGIEDGSWDGVALSRPDGSLAEFLSYEGRLQAVSGPAMGEYSTDIGVAEDPAATPARYSLQKIGGVWQPPAPNTFGARNDGAVTPVPPPVPTPPTILCDGRTATIVGTYGHDILVGTDGPDVIAGLAGDDSIKGLKGDDVICGGPGDDTIYGGAGNDTLFGEDGWDQLYGDKGNDALNGGTGDGEKDVLDGGPGKNAIID